MEKGDQSNVSSIPANCQNISSPGILTNCTVETDQAGADQSAVVVKEEFPLSSRDLSCDVPCDQTEVFTIQIKDYDSTTSDKNSATDFMQEHASDDTEAIQVMIKDESCPKQSEVFSLRWVEGENASHNTDDSSHFGTEQSGTSKEHVPRQINMKRIDDKITNVNFVKICAKDVPFTEFEGHIYFSTQILVLGGLSRCKRKTIDDVLLQHTGNTGPPAFLHNSHNVRKWILRSVLLTLLEQYQQPYKRARKKMIIDIVKKACFVKVPVSPPLKIQTTQRDDHATGGIFSAIRTICGVPIRFLAQEGEVFVEFRKVADSVGLREHTGSHGWKFIDAVLRRHDFADIPSYFRRVSKKNPKREFITREALCVLLRNMTPGDSAKKREFLDEITKVDYENLTSEKSASKSVGSPQEQEVFDSWMENLHQCAVCRKKFSYAVSLEEHVTIHTESVAKPYQCARCAQDFAHTSTLLRHIRTSTRRRLYKCKVCRKYFARFLQLQNHMKIHMEIVCVQPCEDTSENEGESCAPTTEQLGTDKECFPNPKQMTGHIGTCKEHVPMATATEQSGIHEEHVPYPVRMKHLAYEITPLHWVDVCGKFISYMNFEGHIYFSINLLNLSGMSTMDGYERIDDTLIQHTRNTDPPAFLLSSLKARKWVSKSAVLILLEQCPLQSRRQRSTFIMDVVKRVCIEEESCQHQKETALKSAKGTSAIDPNSPVEICNVPLLFRSYEGEVFVEFRKIADCVGLKCHIAKRGWKNVDAVLSRRHFDVLSCFRSGRHKRDFISVKALCVLFREIKAGHAMRKKEFVVGIMKHMESLAAQSVILGSNWAIHTESEVEPYQ